MVMTGNGEEKEEEEEEEEAFFTPRGGIWTNETEIGTVERARARKRERETERRVQCY